MDQDNSKRRVHVERLGLFFAFCFPPGGVANMAKTGVARKPSHISGAVGLTNLTLGFVDRKALTIERCDTRGVLPAMLEKPQRVIDLLINRAGGNHAHNSAHAPANLPFGSSTSWWRGRGGCLSTVWHIDSPGHGRERDHGNLGANHMSPHQRRPTPSASHNHHAPAHNPPPDSSLMDATGGGSDGSGFGGSDSCN